MSRAAIVDPEFLRPWRTAPSIAGIGLIEASLAILCLFLFSQGLVGPLFADPANPDASVVLRLIWLPVYAITGALLIARPGASLETFGRNRLILALVSLTLVSVLWSVSPDTTLRRSFALIMTTLFGLWLASRWSWHELIVLIATMFSGLVVLSTIMALAVPSLGVDHAVHAGAWKGIWWEKNTLGAMMAWGTLSFCAAAMIDRKRAMFWAGFALWASALVLLSTSKTALIAWMIGPAGLIGIILCRQGFGFATLMIFLLVTLFSTIGLVLLIAPVEALQALGRDATLTGRTDIWGVLVNQALEAPWTGFGYKAYWVAEDGPVFWVRQSTGWDVPTAHNGWIELALAIGIPGVVGMAALYLRALARAFGGLFRGPEAYWSIAFIAMIGIVSISESNLMQQNSLGWVLFVTTSAKLAAGKR
jgi:exopolysaccharide production protein ExoQ